MWGRGSLWRVIDLEPWEISEPLGNLAVIYLRFAGTKLSSFSEAKKFVLYLLKNRITSMDFSWKRTVWTKGRRILYKESLLIWIIILPDEYGMQDKCTDANDSRRCHQTDAWSLYSLNNERITPQQVVGYWNPALIHLVEKVAFLKKRRNYLQRKLVRGLPVYWWSSGRIRRPLSLATVGDMPECLL